MNRYLDGILRAYRPLYLRGLLMDGQHSLPPAPSDERAPPAPISRARRRMLLTALTDLHHHRAGRDRP